MARAAAGRSAGAQWPGGAGVTLAPWRIGGVLAGRSIGRRSGLRSREQGAREGREGRQPERQAAEAPG